MFTLTPLNPDNIEHINFTYSILKARYAAQENIHITDNKTETPSLEEHINILKSDHYKYFYIGNYCNVACMIIYIKSKECETGFYFMPQKWNEIYRQHKDNLLQLLKDYNGELPKSKALVSVITAQFYNELFKLHPHLEKDATCKIHVKNNLSQEVARLTGFKSTAIHYRFNRLKIEPRPLSSPWSMKRINIDNEKDVEFTYDILKMRFNTAHINIGARSLPSITEHKHFLKTNYRYYYICSIGDLEIATLYITNNYEQGWFFHLSNLKLSTRKYRDEIKSTLKSIPLKLSLTEIIPWLYQGEIIMRHEELQTKMCASISVNNEWSNSTAAVVGLDPVYISYVR